MKQALWCLKTCCLWVMRSRLAPFKKLAQCIRSHCQGMLLTTPITSQQQPSNRSMASFKQPDVVHAASTTSKTSKSLLLLPS
jgi:hypothetical protein